MQKSFWWWQCSDRYIISLFPHLHTPFPLLPVPNKPLTVSVDVKHHAYLLTDSHWPESESALRWKEGRKEGRNLKFRFLTPGRFGVQVQCCFTSRASTRTITVKDDHLSFHTLSSWTLFCYATLLCFVLLSCRSFRSLPQCCQLVQFRRSAPLRSTRSTQRMPRRKKTVRDWWGGVAGRSSAPFTSSLSADCQKSVQVSTVPAAFSPAPTFASLALPWRV